MMLDDTEIGELFERSTRDIQPGFEAQLLRIVSEQERKIGLTPAVHVPVEVPVRPDRREHGPRRWRVRTALSAAAALATVMAAVVLRDHESSVVVPGSVPTVLDAPIETTPTIELPVTSVAAATTVVPTSSTDGAAITAPLTWTRANAGSIARSLVSKVTSGPVGFVATGMGFDDGANQGRVWFSADGVIWEEPALDIFDALSVYGPAATADAYFVLAFPNADRLPVGSGQMYRSFDGRSWEPVGAPITEPSALGNANGGLLLASPPNLRWSADGQVWTDATIDLSNTGLLDVELPNDPTADVSYIRGLSSSDLQIFESVDGLTWTMLPTPPLGGPVATTPAGLTVMANPDAQRCAQQVSDEVGDPDLQDPTWRDRFLDVTWNCAARLQTTTYDRSNQSWSVPADGPGPTPIFAPLVAVGNTLVAPIIEPGRALTVWTSVGDGATWTSEGGATLQFGDAEQTGSPQAAIAATGHGVVVVISPDRVVGGETAVLRGT